MVMRDSQRQPGYVDPGVYAAAPRNAMQYDPSFIAQAGATMFAPSAPDAYGFGMEPTSSSPTHDSAYVLSPTTFSDQSPWASLGTNGAPGTVPYIGSNGPVRTGATSEACLHDSTLKSRIIRHLLVGKVGRELALQMPGVTGQGDIN